VTLHGASPWHLELNRLASVVTNVTLHGASPWHQKGAAQSDVVWSVRLHGASPWHLELNHAASVAWNVILHGASPWHQKAAAQSDVVWSVRLHGASPWHLELKRLASVVSNVTLPRGKPVASELKPCFCSFERDPPRGKPVASYGGYASWSVTGANLHEKNLVASGRLPFAEISEIVSDAPGFPIIHGAF